ncbi:hypothetical protein BEP19_03680 [Ammoniphilus oxalaticus]|uniref:Zinc chelation protein SecC n=1 Tax=Ammoniphilus oxalaticus TaxID=66863 RepID=A0A419SLJ4_9BACL|nr:hypothetical protein BEP19_03680 [Ammoniphilus oxalaticus]
MTKDELNVIRKELNIKGISQLPKQQLIEELVRQAPDHFQTTIQLFDQPRYALLQRLAREGYTSDFDYEFEQIVYLRKFGLVFTGRYQGQNVFVMPNEIREAFNRIDEPPLQATVKKNTELTRLTHGLLFYYGILSMEELMNLAQQYVAEKIDIEHYIELLHDLSLFYEEYDIGNRFQVMHYRVMDPMWIQDELDLRETLDFYPFTKEQLLRAGELDYKDRTPQYRKFKDFLMKKCRLPVVEAEMLIDDLYDGIQNGDDWMNQVGYLQNELGLDRMEQIQEVGDLLVAYSNHTRQWVLKGYSPAELARKEQKSLRTTSRNSEGTVIDFTTKKKVGRNDPCACGSAEKFKRCCGK